MSWCITTASILHYCNFTAIRLGGASALCLFLCLVCIFLKSPFRGSDSVFLSSSRADHEFCLQFNMAAWLKDTSTTWKFPCEAQATSNSTRR